MERTRSRNTRGKGMKLLTKLKIWRLKNLNKMISFHESKIIKLKKEYNKLFYKLNDDEILLYGQEIGKL